MHTSVVRTNVFSYVTIFFLLSVSFFFASCSEQKEQQLPTTELKSMENNANDTDSNEDEEDALINNIGNAPKISAPPTPDTINENEKQEDTDKEESKNNTEATDTTKNNDEEKTGNANTHGSASEVESASSATPNLNKDETNTENKEKTEEYTTKKNTEKESEKNSEENSLDEEGSETSSSKKENLNADYYALDNKIYYQKESSENPENNNPVIELLEINKENFKVLESSGYAKDVNTVYYKGMKTNIDAQTFVFAKDSMKKEGSYVVDVDSVFYEGAKVEEADKKTFVELAAHVGRDGKYMYFNGKKIFDISFLLPLDEVADTQGYTLYDRSILANTGTDTSADNMFLISHKYKQNNTDKKYGTSIFTLVDGGRGDKFLRGAVSVLKQKTTLIDGQHVYRGSFEKNSFIFWKNGDVVFSFFGAKEEEDSLHKNPFVVMYLKKYPSDLTENDISFFSDDIQKSLLKQVPQE